jgi:hypothetical protein
MQEAEEEVTGEQVRAGDQQVALAGLRPRADPDGVSSAQITAAVMISALIRALACRTAFAARVSMACTNPSDGMFTA